MPHEGKNAKISQILLLHELSVTGKRIFNSLLEINQLQGIMNINSTVKDEQMQRIKPDEKLKRKENLFNMTGYKHD
jgi:hypothetical protein